MTRPTVLLFALCALLGVGLAWVATRPIAPALDEAAVRAIVSDVLAEQQAEAAQSVATLDPQTLNPMIESYLMGNPRILQDMSEKLQAEIETAKAEQARTALASMQAAIYEDPDHVVLGNPNGDVTLVEMFDYNCGYCRSAMPDLATLIAEDPNLKVILKEFPILTEGSIEAAKVAVAFSKTDGDYWTFHEKLFTARGQIDGETALKAAQEAGGNRVTLALEMVTPEVSAVIEKSYKLAQALNITGTPTYIIGDELIPGAIGVDALRQRIANMRACGKTVCDTPSGG